MELRLATQLGLKISLEGTGRDHEEIVSWLSS